jgi:hypothetical protein
MLFALRTDAGVSLGAGSVSRTLGLLRVAGGYAIWRGAARLDLGALREPF